MDVKSIIAVDGPAASGKSTVGAQLAEELGYLYFDTGVMYRAVTLAALNEGADIADGDQVTAIAEFIELDVQPPSKLDSRQYDVLLNGRDVTWEIREPQVDSNVSQVSAYQGVRTAMTKRQREIGLRGKVVMVGRDIGTVVLPEADLKVFLSATVDERARRRYKESFERGDQIPFEEILASLRTRDLIDSTRDIAPLQPAEDAVLIDTTLLSIDEVVAQILRLIRSKDSD